MKKDLKNYVSPNLMVFTVQVEEGLASNSSNLHPITEDGDVQVENWGDGDDVDGNLDW